MGNRVLNIGCHLTVTKGYRHMGRRILELGGNTFQYFSRNPRGGSVKAIDAKDAAGLAEIMEANSFAPILTHAPYTLNMAAAKEETWDPEAAALAEAGVEDECGAPTARDDQPDQDKK